MQIPSSGLATDGHLDLLSSNSLHLQEHGHISLVWTFQPSSFLIFVFASTSIAGIRHVCQFWACFLERSSSSRSGRFVLSSRTWPRTQGMNPKPSARHGSIVLHQIFASVNSSSKKLEICLVSGHVFRRSVSHHAKTSRMVLNLPHVPVTFSKNKTHKDSASFGLIKEFRAPGGDPL